MPPDDAANAQRAQEHQMRDFRLPGVCRPSALLAGMLSFALPFNAWAQSATCATNEPSQSLSFLDSAWSAGSLTYSATVGTGANALQVTGGITNTDLQSGYPVSGVQNGGTSDVVNILVDRTSATATNTITFTFSKPVNNLRMLIKDIDYYNDSAGAYNDQVTIVGTSLTGATVTPTATAANSTYVTVSGNTAYASANASSWTNCGPTDTYCNATFDFSSAVTSITITYANTTANGWAWGNPPAQGFGIQFGGHCLQNGQQLTLAKSWVNGGSNHTATATTSSNRTAPAPVNATFSSTAPGNTTGAAVTVFPNETITLPAETFGGGATQAMYDSTLQCTGGTPLALGSTARSITINTSSTATTCAYTNTRKSATMKLAKAWGSGSNGGSTTVSTTGFVNNTATSGLSTAPNGLTGTSTQTVYAGEVGQLTESTLANYVRSYACSGSTTVDSTGQVTVAPADAGSTITCTITNTPAKADLSITKSNGSSAALVSGANTQYSIVVTNKGPAAVDGAVVKEGTPVGLTCPAAAPNNTVTCSGTGCPWVSGTFAQLQAGVTMGLMAANTSATFTLTCKVN